VQRPVNPNSKTPIMRLAEAEQEDALSKAEAIRRLIERAD
jgi:hypothetical protein